MAKATELKKKDSTGVVTVACKLPNGLILRIFEETEDSEPVLGGGSRRVKKFIPHETSYKVHGNAKPFGQEVDWQIVAGYGLTPNIPRDFWETWETQNAASALVKNSFCTRHGPPFVAL